MINATLTLNIQTVTIADSQLLGIAEFSNGKKLNIIGFTGSAEYFQDTLVGGSIAIVNGSIRAIKDSTGQTELSINVSSAMLVQLPTPIEPTVIAPQKTTAKSTSRKKTPTTV